MEQEPIEAIQQEILQELIRPIEGMKADISPGSLSNYILYHREQFLKKLQFCSTPLDFNDDSKHVKEKADRQAHLQEFNDYLADQNCMTTVIIPHLDLVINMI